MKPFASFASAKRIQRSIVDRQEAVVAEARSIIESLNAKSMDDHAERLIALGFTHAHETREHSERERLAKRTMDLVEKNRAMEMKYPGFRFVTTEVMDAVCKDYGLVIGGVDRYMGSVPKWVPGVIERSGIVKVVDIYIDRYSDGSVYYKSVIKDDWERKYYGEKVNAGTRNTIEKGLDPELLIAAPKKLMRMGANEVVRGNRIVRRDPIVMIEVNGGYIVLAAWDEEGKDPRIINTSSN